ncbi:MAG: phosphoribosylaminoimidazolesuccinocarboxamide synthase [Bacteroidia bacterium]
MQTSKNTSTQTLHFPNQTGFYRGKVRDVYEINHNFLILVASDRISAFDHILPREIPGKGAILNTIAAYFLESTKDIVPNWLLKVADARASVGYKCETFPVEMVIRGYLCGHALREYSKGKRTICGVKMPDGLKPYDPFPEPIITPTTKAHEGHDEDISREDIIAKGLVSEEEYLQLEDYTRKLFLAGSIYAKKQGLLLADTKYEFGKRDGKIMLIDEVHTPDSSRYFYAEGFDEHRKNGTTPKQLSKEFVREWLMENGFQGLEGQQIPEMTDDVVQMILNRYMELFGQITGKKFNPEENASKTPEELKDKIKKTLETL